jgi:hypothetical protein
MAKGETRTHADHNANLRVSLDTLGPEPTISGRWLVKYVSGKIISGESEKGPWSKVNVRLMPVEPVDVDEEVLAGLNGDFPIVEYNKFIKFRSSKLDVLQMLASFGVSSSTEIPEGLDEARGETASVFIRPDGEYNGRAQYAFMNFRPASA